MKSRELLMENEKKENVYKVSICCITYNHEEYIGKAIDGFLSQRCAFDYEILIYDDKSTDKSGKILRNYQKQHPDKIRVVFSTENKYSKGEVGLVSKYLLPIAKGSYIALCEGDDYWTEPDKLAKQVQLLDDDDSLAAVSHMTTWMHGNDVLKVAPKEARKNRYTIYDIIEENPFHTSSMLYRKEYYYCAPLPNKTYGVDWLLNVYAANNGDIGFIPKSMSIYRKHEKGISYQNLLTQNGVLYNHWGNILLRYFAEYKFLTGQHKEKTKEKIIVHLNAGRKYAKVTERIAAYTNVAKHYPVQLFTVIIGSEWQSE